MGDYKKYPVSKNTSEFEMIDILQYHPTYQNLPAQTSQQIIKFMLKSWKSFWKAIKSWKKNPEKFKEKPEPPRML